MVALLLLILKIFVLGPSTPQSRKQRPGHLERIQSEWKVTYNEWSAPVMVRNRDRDQEEQKRVSDVLCPLSFLNKNSVIILFSALITNAANDFGFQGEDAGVQSLLFLVFLACQSQSLDKLVSIEFLVWNPSSAFPSLWLRISNCQTNWRSLLQVNTNGRLHGDVSCKQH